MGSTDSWPVRGLIAVVLGFGLVVAIAVMGTWAAALPGVTGRYLEPASPRALVALFLFCGGFAFFAGAVADRSLRGGWEVIRAAASMLVAAVGLRLSARRAVVVVGLGLVAAVVIYGLVFWMVETIPFPSTEGPDLRWVAVSAAPGWSAGLYFALFAAPAEELLFRGGLLALVQAARQLELRRAWHQRTVVILLLASSGIFGVYHQEHGLANVVTWGVAGLLLGGMALACRSVWPAVIAHCGANFLIAWVPSLM